MNKRALWISLHKQLDADLNRQRQVRASHLHHPVPAASVILGCASSTCQGLACTSLAPGFSCLCSSFGLIVLGCNLGAQTGKFWPVLLLLSSGAETETLGLNLCPGCAEVGHIPGCMPCWPQGSSGSWLPSVWLLCLPCCLTVVQLVWTQPCLPWAESPLPAHLPGAALTPAVSWLQASKQPYSLLMNGWPMQEKSFLVFFILDKHIYIWLLWAETPSYFYAYDDLA